MAWALDARQSGPLSAEARLVLVALADHASREGRGAYLSAHTIAAQLDIDVRSVRRSFRTLRDRSLIRRGDQRIVAHFQAGRRPVVYDLALSRVELPTGELVDLTDPVDDDGVTEASPRRNGAPKPVDNPLWGDVGGTYGVTPTSPKPSTKPKTATHLPYLGDPYARESVSKPAPPPGVIGITDPLCPSCGRRVGRSHRCRASANIPRYGQPPPPPPAPHVPGQTQLELGLGPVCTGCGQDSPDRPLIDELCARCYVAHCRRQA